MIEIDREKARKLLVEEGHTPDKVESLLKDYPELDDRFGPAVEKWMEDRTVVDLEVEGLSIKDVMDKRAFSFLVAVKELNKLLDENLSEEERDRLREALNTPVTFE